MNPTAEPQIPVESEPPRGRAERWAIRLLPLAAAVSLGIFIAAQRMSIERDLRVTAPHRVVPGSALPVRVLLFGDLRAITGARLVVEPVRLSLLEAGARVVSGPVEARPGFGDTLEASLPVPDGVKGQLRLLAELTGQPEALAAEVPVRVSAEGAGLSPQPRRVRKLQGFSEAPVRAVGGAEVPEPLRTRVAGGGCVPEQPCTLWIHVGEPRAAVRVSPSASVSVLAQPDAVSQVARAVVLVHGPEASCELVAERDGAPVARRSVRLPVTLGVQALQLAGAPDAPRLRLLGEPGPCIVDAYAEGRWLSSHTLADCAASFAPPTWSGPAPLRVQVRRDPFASDSASVAVVPTPGPAGLQALAVEAVGRDASDLLARSCRSGACPSGARAYLAALLSEGLIRVPPPASGMARATGRLARHQVRLRWATLVSLGLCALSLSVLVVRRGLSGSAQARAWMNNAEDAEARTRRAQRRGWLLVWACAAALTLAFVAVALYVIARS